MRAFIFTENETRLKRGDVREDGMIFWQYSKNYKTGERWVSSDKFASMKERLLEKQREMMKNPEKRKRVRNQQKEWASKPENKSKIARRRNSESSRAYMREYQRNRRKDESYRERENKKSNDSAKRRRPQINAKAREKYATNGNERARVAWRNATKRAWKGGQSSFDIIGLTKEEAIRVYKIKRWIARKYFPTEVLHHDHMEPISKARDFMGSRKRSHFTNFVLIPSKFNQSKSAKSFDDWFSSLSNKRLRLCILDQIEFNKSIQSQLDK